jgi:hypothetical protein
MVCSRSPQSHAAEERHCLPKAGTGLVDCEELQQQGSAGAVHWTARAASQLLSAAIDSGRKR